MRPWLIALLLSLLTSGCSVPLQSGDPLFVDDFSRVDSGWNRQADGDATTDYLDGEYQVEVLTPNLNVWATAGPRITDAVIDLNARTAGGTDNNLFGVICRYQDPANFYFLVISADSYYGIGKFKEGRSTLLHSSVYEYSDKILPGAATHHLTARCVGNTLTLAVNGTQIAEATDSDFPAGQVGLIAGTFDDWPVDIRFDNLVVAKP